MRTTDVPLSVVRSRVAAPLAFAALVAEGLTNRQIAERLCVSEGTARTHVERILRKLGVHSRVQVATLVAEHARSRPE